MRLPVFKDPVNDTPSFSITVAAITFAVVLVKWMIGGVVFRGHTFQPVTESEINTWLTPTLVFYLARQVTKAVENVSMAKIDGPSASPSTVNVNMPGAP